MEPSGETLWMVPDLQSFVDAVLDIDFASQGYKVEIADSENVLLLDDEDENEDAENDDTSGDGLSNADDEHPGSRAIAAAMSVNGGQIPLEEDATFRLSPKAGDYLLWIRCTDSSQKPAEFGIPDFWEFREGDQLLITNREEDYPATVEEMEEGGPCVWKAQAGDRLAWVGWRLQSNERKPTLVALIICRHQAYVYGEPESPTVDSVMWFGAPRSEPTSDVQRLWRVGYDAAVGLKVPRVGGQA